MKYDLLWGNFEAAALYINALFIFVVGRARYIVYYFAVAAPHYNTEAFLKKLKGPKGADIWRQVI